MPRPSPRKLNLADVMILVAMTGVGLSIYLVLDNALFRGQRYFFGLFQRPVGGWDATEFADRAAGALAVLLLLFGGWTLALPVLRLRRPRAGWRRRNRQAGMTACFAAVVGMALCGGVVGFAVLLRWLADGPTRWPANFRIMAPVFDVLIVNAGVSVAAVWVIQAASGSWRPSADWIDRLGRFLGGLWIAASLIFSMRLLMG